MNLRSRLIFSFVLAMAFAPMSGRAESGGAPFNAFQQGVAKGPIAAPRDPEMEKQSYHNLEVAKYYFYKRKPDKNDKDAWARLNKSVEGRLTEIMDTNPAFARMDDVYFMLGEVYKRMGDLDKAVEYWEKATKEGGDEKIKSEARKRLDESKKKS
jgi:tetratricopeptide (TPR) repeat protein